MLVVGIVANVCPRYGRIDGHFDVDPTFQHTNIARAETRVNTIERRSHEKADSAPMLTTEMYLVGWPRN